MRFHRIYHAVASLALFNINAGHPSTAQCVDKPLSSGKPWQDKAGNDCAKYSSNRWCSGGGLGEGWPNDYGLGEVEVLNIHGIDEGTPDGSCCVCGGGLLTGAHDVRREDTGSFSSPVAYTERPSEQQMVFADVQAVDFFRWSQCEGDPLQSSGLPSWTDVLTCQTIDLPGLPGQENSLFYWAGCVSNGLKSLAAGAFAATEEHCLDMIALAKQGSDPCPGGWSDDSTRCANFSQSIDSGKPTCITLGDGAYPSEITAAINSIRLECAVSRQAGSETGGDVAVYKACGISTSTGDLTDITMLCSGDCANGAATAPSLNIEPMIEHLCRLPKVPCTDLHGADGGKLVWIQQQDEGTPPVTSTCSDFAVKQCVSGMWNYDYGKPPSSLKDGTQQYPQDACCGCGGGFMANSSAFAGETDVIRVRSFSKESCAGETTGVITTFPPWRESVQRGACRELPSGDAWAFSSCPGSTQLPEEGALAWVCYAKTKDSCESMHAAFWWRNTSEFREFILPEAFAKEGLQYTESLGCQLGYMTQNGEVCADVTIPGMKDPGTIWGSSIGISCETAPRQDDDTDSINQAYVCPHEFLGVYEKKKTFPFVYDTVVPTYGVDHGTANTELCQNEAIRALGRFNPDECSYGGDTWPAPPLMYTNFYVRDSALLNLTYNGHDLYKYSGDFPPTVCADFNFLEQVKFAANHLTGAIGWRDLFFVGAWLAKAASRPEALMATDFTDVERSTTIKLLGCIRDAVTNAAVTEREVLSPSAAFANETVTVVSFVMAVGCTPEESDRYNMCRENTLRNKAFAEQELTRAITYGFSRDMGRSGRLNVAVDLLVTNERGTLLHLPGNLGSENDWATWEVTIVMPTAELPIVLKPLRKDIDGPLLYDLAPLRDRIAAQLKSSAFSRTLTKLARVKIGISDTDDIARSAASDGGVVSTVCGGITNADLEVKECTLKVNTDDVERPFEWFNDPNFEGEVKYTNRFSRFQWARVETSIERLQSGISQNLDPKTVMTYTTSESWGQVQTGSCDSPRKEVVFPAPENDLKDTFTCPGVEESPPPPPPPPMMINMSISAVCGIVPDEISVMLTIDESAMHLEPEMASDPDLNGTSNPVVDVWRKIKERSEESDVLVAALKPPKTSMSSETERQSTVGMAKVISQVMTVTIEGVIPWVSFESPGTVLDPPFEWTAPVAAGKSFGAGETPICAFYDTLEQVWRTEGVTLKPGTESAPVCLCSHTTSFAVLVSVDGSAPSGADSEALTYITYIGVGISLLCFAITAWTYSAFRHLRSTPKWILVNICITLMIAEATFIAGLGGDEARSCTAIGIVTHYFLLAGFAWMLCEGYHVFRTFTDALNQRASADPLRKYMFFSYIVPAVVVGVTAGTKDGRYGLDEKHCFLVADRGAIWAFVGPMLAVCSVNVYFFIRILVAVYNARVRRSTGSLSLEERAKRERNIRTKRTVQASFSFFALMGLGWLFGLFAMESTAPGGYYVFTIVNALQGLFIFVFHCALDGKAREAWTTTAEGRRSKAASAARTPKSPSSEGRSTGGGKRSKGATLDSGVGSDSGSATLASMSEPAEMSLVDALRSPADPKVKANGVGDALREQEEGKVNITQSRCGPVGGAQHSTSNPAFVESAQTHSSEHNQTNRPAADHVYMIDGEPLSGNIIKTSSSERSMRLSRRASLV